MIVVMFKVKAQWKERLYCSCLGKATKHKADKATGEVHVENQNHGPMPDHKVAKNRTVQRLKVKNDHHSKFSNLSNWKEEA